MCRAMQVLILFLMAITIHVAVATISGMQEYNVTWYDGSSTTYRYARNESSECIYERQSDHQACMDNYRFSTVMPVWRYHAFKLLYVGVRCLDQTLYTDHKKICICKTGKTAASASDGRPQDGVTYCHIRHISVDIFKTLTNLEVLDLRHNIITAIEPHSFDYLRNLKLMYLSGNPIRDIPDHLFCSLEKLLYLELRNTTFTTFPSRSFDCHNMGMRLKHLDSSSGLLSDLGHDPVNFLPQLTFWNLSSNMLQYVDSNSFHGAISIEALDLSRNHIHAISDAFCSQMPNLEILKLNYNNFETFNFLHLNNCFNLIELDLSNNRLSVLTGTASNMPNLRRLLMRSNSILALQMPDLFLNAPMLEELDLSNNHIQIIHRNTLRDLVHVKVLNLSRNEMSHDLNDISYILQDLTNLTYLDLSYNKITIVKNYTFQNLTQIKHLHLSYNDISEMETDGFAGLDAVEMLKLNNNKFVSLNLTNMHSMQQLNFLDLSYNSLLSLEGILPSWVEHLALNHNKLRITPAAFNNSNLTFLSLDHNPLTILEAGMFSDFGKLKSLDISFSHISDIEALAFQNLVSVEDLNMEGNQLNMTPFSKDVFYGLQNAKILNLANNNLSGVGGILHFSSTNTVLTLNVSHNPIIAMETILRDHSADVKELRHLDLHACDISRVDVDAFINLPQLVDVNLEDNIIEEFQPLITFHDVVYYLNGNPLICTCRMSWIKEDRISIPGNMTSFIYPSNFHFNGCLKYPENIIVPIPSVPRQSFLCISQDECDPLCQCYSQAEDSLPYMVVCKPGLTSLPGYLSSNALHIHMDGNNFVDLGLINAFSNQTTMNAEVLYLNRSNILGLHEQALRNFPALKVLNLAGNFIDSLPQHTLSNHVVLEVLDLSNNVIVFLEPGLFSGLNSLKVLKVNGNRIKTLMPETITDLSSLPMMHTYYLGHNQWRCYCHSQAVREWIIEIYDLIADRHEVKCGNIEIYKASDVYFECPANRASTVGLVIGVIILLILAFAIVILIRYRREVIAVFYVKLRFRWLKPQESVTENKLYDCLVVHDAHDEDCSAWVNGTLSSQLEFLRLPYRVFIPDRDDPSSATANVTEHVAVSRCSLVVISKNYAANNACQKYFQTAYRRMVDISDHKVILIFYGSVDISSINPEIKAMLANGDYLTKRARLFWVRLRYELPRPRARGLEVSETDVGVSDSDIIIDNAIALNDGTVSHV